MLKPGLSRAGAPALASKKIVARLESKGACRLGYFEVGSRRRTTIKAKELILAPPS